jgi:hypothetical protein
MPRHHPVAEIGSVPNRDLRVAERQSVPSASVYRAWDRSVRSSSSSASGDMVVGAKGAGRRPNGERAGVPHGARVARTHREPVLVTMKLRAGLTS